MRRLLRVYLPCLFLPIVAAAIWRAIPSHDDAFDARNVLTANADELDNTLVSAHLEVPITTGRNIVWCGTFQLAWNEACSLVGEALRFTNNEPEMVAVLNQQSFVKEHLDEASYVALAGFVGDDIHGRIERELQRRFNGRASPKSLPPRGLTPRPQDIVTYAYLFKDLAFENVFERITEPLSFGMSRVPCFGIDDRYKSGQLKLLEQVVVLDYQSPDDFVIELLTKESADRVILAKMPSEVTLAETIQVAQSRMASGTPIVATAGDVLKVPKFNFDITRRYRELIALQLSVSNPKVADDLQIMSAEQNTRFQLDERGVKLRSDAHISFGCSKPGEPEPAHIMIFDRPFLIFLQRSDASVPYFAMWVDNAELLVHTD